MSTNKIIVLLVICVSVNIVKTERCTSTVKTNCIPNQIAPSKSYYVVKPTQVIGQAVPSYRGSQPCGKTVPAPSYEIAVPQQRCEDTSKMMKILTRSAPCETPQRNNGCGARYGYVAVEGNNNCYRECQNYQPIVRQCPKAQVFDCQAKWPENPCRDVRQEVAAATPYVERAVETRPVVRSNRCSQRNAYMPVAGNNHCYTECQNYQQVARQCPESQVFDCEVQWPQNPCRAVRQQVAVAVPYVETRPVVRRNRCSQRNAYMPVAENNHCYTECQDYQQVAKQCPETHVFDREVQWPQNPCKRVVRQEVAAYPEFQCPAPESEEYVVTRHKYEPDCQYYYMCENGNARMASCNPGYCFNEYSSSCALA